MRDFTPARCLRCLASFAAVLLSGILLAACGGGSQHGSSEPTPSRLQSAQQLAQAGTLPDDPRRRALNVPRRDTAPLSAEALFDWAEQRYPALFPRPAGTATWDRYTYRYYPTTGNYIAVADGAVYVLGPFTGQKITRVGTQEDFHCSVLPADCVPPAVSLAPAQLTSIHRVGDWVGFTVRASATDLSAFSGVLHVYVVDSQRILQGGVHLFSVDDRQVDALLQVSTALAPGRYAGTLLIQLCRDSACAEEYAGSPVRLPYDLHVVSERLRAVAATERLVIYEGTVPPDLPVDVTGPGLAWTAHTSAPWLKLHATAGSGTARFTVAYQTRDLSPGHYDGTVEVQSSDDQKVSVPVRIEVKPPASFWTHIPQLEFSGINGRGLDAQFLRFGNSAYFSMDWTARAGSSWIEVTPSVGHASQGSQTRVEITPQTDGLASGEHRTEIVLSALGMATRVVPVTLRLQRASLSASLPGQAASSSAPTLTFGGDNGRDTTPQALDVQLGTGTRAWPWTLGSMPAWLSASPSHGMVNEMGVRIQFTPKLEMLPAGGGSATVTLTSKVSGDTLTLPIRVEFNTPPRRLLPSHAGVGLSSTPDGSFLSKALRIDDNQGQVVSWSARSSATWLKVTAGGRTGVERALVVTADPNAAPANALSRATVTVSSNAVGVVPIEIPVVLWNSSSSGDAQKRIPLSDYFASIAADTIRPYFYVGVGGSIEVWHAHRGVKVATLPGVGGNISSMAVSPDGARLYAVDHWKKRMLVYDLESMKAVTDWALSEPYLYSSDPPVPLVVKPNGTELIVLSDGHAFTPSGKLLGRTSLTGVQVASPDSRRIFVSGDRLFPPLVVERWALDHSGREGDPPLLRKELAGDYKLPFHPWRLVLNPDGSHLFTDRCQKLDAVALKPGVPLALTGYTYVASMTVDGRVLCGGDPRDGNNVGLPDLSIYRSSDGAPLRTYRISPVTDSPPRIHELAVTPDGLVAGVLLQGGTLVLQRVAP